MRYFSTRGGDAVTGSQAILTGLAPDGGLYLPESLPEFCWQDAVKCSTMEIAQMILSAFLPELDHMDKLVENAYHGKFATDALTPTVATGKHHVLELFHGPTSAFKDVALCMLPQLMMASRNVRGEKEDVLILTATSGDTGKAALEGFKDVPGINICVFYPHGGVSDVQRRQMVSQEGNNVRVCAVRGNFDDCQTGVKQIFSADTGLNLSSANSINIGRLLPQITYYFAAYRDLLANGTIQMGDEVNFSVPTGNFGDILAGYLAKKLGLPVGMLLCASNANNVLTDFIRTGTYDRRRMLHKTISPSMDILVSSNLERLLHLVSGDSQLVASLMHQLGENGHYTVPEDLLQQIQAQFWAGYCDDNQASSTINAVWQEQHYLCDPHTAAGWKVAEDYVNQTQDQRPMVVLSTASPYKFPAAVLQAIGGDTQGDEFTQMEQLEALTGVCIPKNLAGLRSKPERHLDVISKEDMMKYVIG